MKKVVAFVAVGALLPVLLAAAPARSGATGTRPAASVPATRAVDRSAPDKTWGALCAAVRSGDLAGFRACCYSRNEISKVFMEAYSDNVVTSFQLAAAVGQLGEEGKTMSKSLEGEYADLVKLGQDRKVVAKGDTAQWVQTVAAGSGAKAERVMYFKQVGKEWLLDTEQSYSLDTADGRKAAETFVAESAGTLKLLKGVVADIKAGKIKTVGQMREKIGGK